MFDRTFAARMKTFVVLVILLAVVSVLQQPGGPVAHARPLQVKDSIVYITRSGKKYHREDCPYLSKSKFRVTLREAIENRYEACKRCYKQADQQEDGKEADTSRNKN